VGYGWTHVGGDTYVYDVGDLGVQEGGQKNFWVKVNENECSNEAYIFNWAHIGGNEAECNLANNWSVEETPAELPPCEYGFYLPLICRQYTPSKPPKPKPEPVRAFISDVAVNSETNRVYVASPQQNAVLAVDPTGDGSIIASIPVGQDPKGVAVETTQNKIYAANFQSWTVTAIRGSDHTPIKDLYVGAQAAKVVTDSGDNRVYVTNHLESDNGAAAISSQSDSFEYYYNRLHATQGRYGIDMDPNAEKLFIAARDAGLIAIQDAFYPQQEPEVVKLEPARVPFVVAFNPVTNHLFVTAADDNLVVVLAPYSIQWGQGKWVMWRGREVFLLDRANAGWIKEVPVGSGAEEGIAVNPLTGYLYVTNADDDTVSVLKDSPDPMQITHIQDIDVGDRPQGIAVDVERNLIYVGNTDSRDLSVIDGVEHKVIKTIPLE
jgi:YVTN family beta-propeller protein